MKNLPPLYQNHLEKYFSGIQYLMVSIVIMLLQKHREIKLEKLAENFPSLIQQRSRIKKLQRFLSLAQWDVKKIWFPIFMAWLEQEFERHEVLYLAIDRSQWGKVNLLMISLIYKRRAIPIYFTILGKLGNTNAEEQIQAMGIYRGMSVYHQGVKVTKSKGFGPFNIAAKWKKTYRGWSVDEAWFLMTNLPSLDEGLDAYARRMGIEEMFRDFKSGGYNLEATQVRGQRLEALILLTTLAYSQATFCGQSLQSKGVAKYVARPTSPGRKYRQHSYFYLGLQGFSWLNSLTDFASEVQLLISLAPQSRRHYQRGLKAVSLLQSVF